MINLLMEIYDFYRKEGHKPGSLFMDRSNGDEENSFTGVIRLNKPDSDNSNSSNNKSGYISVTIKDNTDIIIRGEYLFLHIKGVYIADIHYAVLYERHERHERHERQEERKKDMRDMRDMRDNSTITFDSIYVITEKVKEILKTYNKNL